METVLITGASRGIGAEFARLFAKKGCNLILVARTKADLQKVKQEVQTDSNSVLAIAADLTKPNAIKNLYEAIAKEKLVVDTLINNAGFGDFAYFADADIEKQESMIQLNITALTKMAHYFLLQRNAQEESFILNVASVAGLFPGPKMSVYFATKAYVLSFSQALAQELQRANVTVTCLCPGMTQSDFHKVAHNENAESHLTKYPTAAQVAEFGIKSLESKKRVAVHGFSNKLATVLAKLLPSKIITAMVEKSWRDTRGN